jgi:hypothetical protein
LTRRAWVLPATIVAIMTAMSLPTAQAATGTAKAPVHRWHLVASVGPVNGDTEMRFLVAPSRADAWSWSYGCAPCTGTHHGYVILEHWNGRHWSTINVPSTARGVVGLAASSARNAWLFTTRVIGARTVGHALIWSGSWHRTRLPDWVLRPNTDHHYRIQPEVFGPRSVWVFTLGVAVAAEYNGHSWVERSLPGRLTRVSAVSARDIWAVGQTNQHRAILMHWTGASWHTDPIPRPAHVPPHATEPIGGLAATSNSAWLIRDVPLSGTHGARTLAVLHWDGRSWHQISFRYPVTFTPGIASDGHDGVWFTSLFANGFSWRFVHLTSAGKWTRQAVPTRAGTLVLGLTSIARVPGTSSLWATGVVAAPTTHAAAAVGGIYQFSQ